MSDLAAAIDRLLEFVNERRCNLSEAEEEVLKDLDAEVCRRFLELGFSLRDKPPVIEGHCETFGFVQLPFDRTSGGMDLWPFENWLASMRVLRQMAEVAAAPDPPLGERAQLVLTVLLKEEAFDSDHRLKTESIAALAAGSNADPNQFKEVIAQLGKLGYVDTKEGRGGGCWLTASGRKRAERL